MIVETVEPIALRIPSRNAALYLVLCRITTRDGIEGFGECLCGRAAMQQALVATIRDTIAPAYQGQAVDNRAMLNRDLRRRFASLGRSGTIVNALAAVDIALWDIAGKNKGQSLSTMIGGAGKQSIDVMASLDRYGDMARVRTRVEDAVASGVAAVKVHEADLTVIEAARQAVDSKTPFIADLNNAHGLSDIRRDIVRWQALNLFWLEDPVWPPEDMLSCPPLSRLPVALGADLGSAEQLELYARAPAVDFIQPDVCMIGGVSEMLKFLNADRRPELVVAPHTPFVGPAALASLHFVAALAEPAYFATIEATDALDMFGMGLQQWRPTINVPKAPGLGADPDPAFLARYKV